MADVAHGGRERGGRPARTRPSDVIESEPAADHGAGGPEVVAQPATDVTSPTPEDGSAGEPTGWTGPLCASDLVLEEPLGRRVLVVANLLLGPQATAASTWAAAGVARALQAWQGPGTVIVAGNLFDLAQGTADAALRAHPKLADALAAFARDGERRVVVLAGTADAALAEPGADRTSVEALGATVARAAELQLTVATGCRVVRVDPVVPALWDGTADPARPGPSEHLRQPPPAGSSGMPGPPLVARDPSQTWQEGLDRLAEPAAAARFLTSRLLYRRLSPFAWALLLPFLVAVFVGLPATSFLERVMRNPTIHRAHLVPWDTRLIAAGVVSAVGLLALIGLLAWLSRRAWRTLGGGALPGVFEDPLAAAGTTANDPARDAAVGLQARGYAGLVTGATLQAELTHLAGGFFACAGTCGEVVEEHPGRLGLPPVFLHHRQVAWVELETGADLHARLLLARADVTPASFLERLAARYRPVHDPHPIVVAAHPAGSSWPPAPDLTALRRRSRRARRWAGAAIAVAGVVDLLSGVTPPLRHRLHLLLQVVPLGASQLAGALVALAGMGLLALARGIRRGQHRAWVIAVAVLSASLVLHLLKGIDFEESALSALVLWFLLATRAEFRAEADKPSLRSALIAVVAGAVGIATVTTVLLTVSLHFDRDAHFHLPFWRAGEAVVERMVGVRSVPLPARVDGFLSASLLAIFLALAAVTVVLATRPVVDRRRTSGRLGELRARDVVRRHGAGTLDYFALRSDKRWFFHRDSLVAYAIYGGICLVSPDPIGPRSEREQVWEAFRRFADSQGWAVAVMGASEDWLPVYRSVGMHDIYIGDEAVVDVQRFSLAGGEMKGLRQAYNRIAKYGYRASFHDPAHLDRQTAQQLTALMAQSRRGEFERGFSMMLGRIFDPRDEGLLLCIVWAPDGSPAAMCQFVPAPGIDGYSLDLMRRDRGEHPNGLIDFALVSTIEHLRQQHKHGLSLNFAAMRAIFEGERGDGVIQRVERWALRKMSSFVQIETLWRFNAKYKPDWLARYVVYDTAEHLVPAIMAILRAESLWEVPVIGRVIAASDRRAAAAGARHDPTSALSLLPETDRDAGEKDGANQKTAAAAADDELSARAAAAWRDGPGR